MASSTSTRLFQIGRAVLPWLIGPTALVLRRRVIELAPPSPCPGLLELFSIAAVRNSPDLAVGPLFGALHAIAITVALGLFVKLAARENRDWAAAAATGLAIGLSPLFASTLAPPWEAAAFAVCAGAALLTASMLDRPAPRIYRIAGLAGLLLVAALIVPAWIVVAAAGAGVIVSGMAFRHARLKRWLMGSAAAAALACLALIVLRLSPPAAFTDTSPWRALSSCTLPLPATGRAVAFASTIAGLLGPFALALAGLGTIVEAQRAGWRRTVVVALLGLACLAAAAGTAIPLHIVLAPWIVAVWWLAASGLGEIVSMLGRAPLIRVVSMLFVLWLPTLQAARFNAQERDDWVRPNGHERATLRQVIAGLNLVAPDATFVEEDSTIDILLRAAVFDGRRKDKRFTVRPLEPAAIAQAVGRGPVYAFPKRREDLSLRGFTTDPLAIIVRRRDDTSDKIEGIAAVTGLRPCQTVGYTWADLAGGVPSGRIAIAAPSETTYGPVVVYLGGSTAVEPRPDAWPSRTIRGYRVALFDQRSGERSARLMDEARELGLPAEHPVLAAPFVVRLTLHRTPRAPLSLAVVLGAAFPLAVTSLEPGSVDTEPFRLCDAPTVAIAPFGSRAE